jgi:hypothetical protein
VQRTKIDKVAVSDAVNLRNSCPDQRDALGSGRNKFQILIVFLFLLPVSRLELLWCFEPYSVAINELGSVVHCLI